MVQSTGSWLDVGVRRSLRVCGTMHAYLFVCNESACIVKTLISIRIFITVITDLSALHS
jgi:hypothetical protein